MALLTNHHAVQIDAFCSAYQEWLDSWGDDIDVADFPKFDEERADWGEDAIQILTLINRELD